MISRLTLSVLSHNMKRHQYMIIEGLMQGMFYGKLESLGKELYKKIKNANAEIIYGEKEKEEFEIATKCHICVCGLPRNSTKIDHLGKIHQWVRSMRLSNRVPSQKEIEDKKYSPNINLPKKQFLHAKAKLRVYLKENNDVVVRDHCHWTGKFRGAAHQHCNIMYRKTYNIPCFFHNFTGYDSHHIFQNISSLEKAPTVVAKSLEKFISMEIEHRRIQDS